MFCTMALFISSSLPGPIFLLVQELLGDMTFPETLFSIAASAIPLKVASEVQMGIHDSVIPFFIQVFHCLGTFMQK